MQCDRLIPLINSFLNIQGQTTFGLLPSGEDGGSNGKNVLVDSGKVCRVCEPRTAP